MVLHAPHGVVDVALQRASDLTGIDSSFLVGAAARESGYNPKARAAASSASGLFQFVDQSWLATLKRHGARYGYARYADLIQRGPDGRWRAKDAAARAEVMNLRLDPRAASLMAGEMAADHVQFLRAATGRAPTGGELYAAHFLGAEGTARLIALTKTQPQAEAAALFPEAARANPTVFRPDGRSLSIAELYGDLTKSPVARVLRQDGKEAFARWAAGRRADTRRLHRQVIEAAVQRRGGVA